MEYKIINPPFSLDFKDMPKKELKAWYNWFLGAIPERIKQLEGIVRDSTAFMNWKADKTPDSLDALGQWFALNVETRKRTNHEIQDIVSKLIFPISVPEYELTVKTFSLSIDIGMYLGEVFLENRSALKWDLPLKSKNFVDYGRPVLLGFGKVPFNPVQMTITLAYGIVRGKRNNEGLRRIYDIWIEEQSIS